MNSEVPVNENVGGVSGRFAAFEDSSERTNDI
jgi:hypothetical protein